MGFIWICVGFFPTFANAIKYANANKTAFIILKHLEENEVHRHPQNIEK